MTDAEMVKAMEICKDKEIPCDDCPLAKCGDCGEISRQYFYDRFKQLQSENAALRERLEKAEAEKSKLIPYIEQDNDGDYLVYRAEYILQYIIDSICRTPEAALARLAELKGGKNE